MPDETPTSAAPGAAATRDGRDDHGSPTAMWPLWEVFVRVPRSLSHVHAGSVHAPDDATAMRHARSLYAPRQDGVSVWVAPSAAITTSADVPTRTTDVATATAATDTTEVPPCR